MAGGRYALRRGASAAWRRSGWLRRAGCGQRLVQCVDEKLKQRMRALDQWRQAHHETKREIGLTFIRYRQSLEADAAIARMRRRRIDADWAPHPSDICWSNIHRGVWCPRELVPGTGASRGSCSPF